MISTVDDFKQFISKASDDQLLELFSDYFNDNISFDLTNNSEYPTLSDTIIGIFDEEIEERCLYNPYKQLTIHDFPEEVREHI